MNKLICKNCGHIKLNIGNDIYDERCELCGYIMYPEEETLENEGQVIQQLVNEDKEDDIIGDNYPNLPRKDYYTIDEIVEMDLVESVSETIKNIGHKRTWECIERLVNAKQRGRFRMLFIKAGGKIPEKEM